jgi:predicted DsbA family dithiol-disulfide isomerase
VAAGGPAATLAAVEATCWTDYLCPWCYLGRHRSEVIEDLGVPVHHRPYELHPEIPPEGRPVRPDGRLGPTFDRIEAECAEIGRPFRRPTRMPNTRRALETAEVVRLEHPSAFTALDESLFRAHFAEGLPIDDRDLLDELVAAAGAPPEAVRDAVGRGVGWQAVDASMHDARAAGVTSTPSWLIGDAFLIPGAQEPETVRRWVSRLLDRSQRSA